MTTRTKGRKRRRSHDNDQDFNNKNKKRQRIESLQLIELSEYFCCICSELSSGKILQCPNGCLICETWYVFIAIYTFHSFTPCVISYPKICPMKCPLCRVGMSKTKPIRCRIAEKALASRLVTCRHEGCGEEVTFAKLQHHEQKECKYLPIDCKFKLLGCSWNGLKQDQREHELQCECDQDESLKIVREMDDQLKIYQKFCNLCTNLSSSTVEPLNRNNNSSSFEDEFLEETDDFYYEGYEYIIRIKSEKKRVRRKNVYQIKAKIVFAEDVAQIPSTESDPVHIGLIISSKLLQELSFTLTPSNTQSEWFVFDKELNCEEYVRLYREGFDVKIFCFGEDI